MSAFTRNQSLAHPEWLDQFWKDFDSQTALIRNKRMPEVLWFPFITVLACRMLRIAFRSRWAAARYILRWAFEGAREDLYGIAVRFWRYKILMRSQARDLHEMMSYRCLKCAEMHPFNETGDDEFVCDGCGWKTDFSGICEMTPADD